MTVLVGLLRSIRHPLDRWSSSIADRSTSSPTVDSLGAASEDQRSVTDEFGKRRRTSDRVSHGVALERYPDAESAATMDAYVGLNRPGNRGGPVGASQTGTADSAC